VQYGAFLAWRDESKMLILINTSMPTPSAFDLSSHTVKRLESNTSFYLWAN
jgi:hypothetical protein